MPERAASPSHGELSHRLAATLGLVVRAAGMGAMRLAAATLVAYGGPHAGAPRGMWPPRVGSAPGRDKPGQKIIDLCAE